MHVRHKAKKRAGLSHFSSEACLDGQHARLDGDLLCFRELAAQEMDEAPGQRGTNAVGDASRLDRLGGERTLVNGDGCRSGTDAEVQTQTFTQPLELPYDLTTIARIESRLHERALSPFVGGIQGEQLFPQARRLEYLRIELAQPFARLLGPLNVSIVRK